MNRMLLLLAGLSASTAAAAPPPMAPGLWEVTMSMEMAGMPRGMPPTKAQHCYRPSEVKDLRKTLPPTQENCKLSDWKQLGNTVNWTMNCSGEAAMRLTGTMTYSGDRYTGVNQMTANRGGRTVNMTQKIDARRIGDCK